MSLNLSIDKNVSETKEFISFSRDIDYLICFFQMFSELIFYNGRFIPFQTDEKSFLLTTSLISSSAKTLQSIKLCCSIGSFSDANALIRKLRDDLIQYAYILSVINSRISIIEDNSNELKGSNSFSNIRFNDVLTDDEKAISAWFSNKVSELNRPIKRKLEFENYMKTLKQNDGIAKVLDDYKLSSYWEVLRKRLNDYVHNNGEVITCQNLIDANDINLEVHLNNINKRISYISSFFITVLLMIDSSLISSSDYIDYLECNQEPPEDSQHLIAPFIQEFLDEKVSKLHPELKNYLKDNNINGMKIV